jgi:hypothetical protein
MPLCDASNNQVPDPVLSQGDTIQMCVRLSTNSSYYLEDIYMMAPHSAYHRRPGSLRCIKPQCIGISHQELPAGLVHIRSQVPSRFFDQDSDRDSDPVRIVGVALLNLFR